jgi:predicted deacylase
MIPQRPVWTRVIAEVDYEQEGKQAGRLLLPQSHDESAWGVIAILVVKNGSGPTLLLTAGIHGDEYLQVSAAPQHISAALTCANLMPVVAASSELLRQRR